MSNRELEERVIPHLVHLACSAAIIVLSAKILHEVCHIRKGLRKIKEGRREIEEGREEITGRKKK